MQKYYCYVQKNRLFWASCRNITGQEPGAPGFSCRAIFGVREEILVFRRNIHLCNDDGGFEDAAADDGDDGSHDALLLVFSGAHSAMSS